MWLGIILILSFLPGDQLPKIDLGFFKVDLFVHLFFYFVLTFLMLNAFEKKNEPFLMLFVYISVITIFIGFFVEIIQGNYIKNRFFDKNDIFANAIGTLIGLLFFVWIKKILKFR